MRSWFSVLSKRGLADFCLGIPEDNITWFQQNGADGTFETDDYIGFAFTLAADTPELPAGTYEYKVGSGSLLGAANAVPVADAGSAQSVVSGTQVTLSGSGADSDGTIVSYAWTRTGGTGDAANSVLSDPTAPNPTFTDSSLNVGDSDVTHVFELVVTDNDGATSTPASVTITVTAPANTAPTADAGADATVASGAAVTLDGSGSDAKDAGQGLTYAWSQTGGTAVTLSDANAASPGFTAPTLVAGSADAVLTFALVVNDGVADSAADTVEITVTAPADVEPPVISSIPDVETDTDEGVNTASVVLAASATDNSGETITPVFSVDGTPITSPHDFPVGGTVVTVNAKDSSGNEAEPRNFTVTVNDTTAPDKPNIVAATADQDGKASVLGTAEPGSTVIVTFPDGTTVTVTADPTTGAFIATSTSPQKSGEITVIAVDGAGNESPIAEIDFVGDDTPPTIFIGELAGPSNGTYSAAITLSEDSGDFSVEDLTLSNASATLTGSGTAYVATVTPYADGDIRLSVAAGTFTDTAGNANIASNEVSATYDGTSPAVQITGEPAFLAATTTFSVTMTFSESVTGFEASDIVVTNADVVGLSGTGAVYSAMLTASGTGDVTVSVPANSALDAAGNGNLASNTVSIADVTVERTQELIAGFMQTRANQLVRNQPDLIPFLSAGARGTFNLDVTRGRGNFDFASDPARPVWMRANGSWTTDGVSESRYAFGAIGSHWSINENLLLGAMLQFDHLEEDTGKASVSGTGWMVGPYFVAKAPSQPLYFEGRLLYGQTRNDISPFGTYEDSFDTTRMIAQLKVAGDLVYGETTVRPFLDASYTTDDQKTYVDSLGNAIPGQSIELGQIEIGMDFSRMIDVSYGTLEIWGGASGIWSHTSGSGFASTITPDYEGGRARVDLGLNHTMSANRNFSASTFYDGIGADGFESYGLSLGYEMRF